MYVLQRDRINSGSQQLADSLLAFQIGHDLGLILAPDTHTPKRRANDALKRVDLYVRQQLSRVCAVADAGVSFPRTQAEAVGSSG
jgi:hypothetical protein